MGLFSKHLGIDLGTANTLVHLKGKGIVLREPTVVAIHNRSRRVIAVGNDAKLMMGRTPASISVIRPLKDGVIADFGITQDMMKVFIKKACKSTFFGKPTVIICVPSGVTEVEKKAVLEATEKAGAKEALLIEEPKAAALGANLPIEEPSGCMVVDIGGGTSEVAVLSLGGIVTTESLRVAGDDFDEAIINYLKKEHNLLIGERTAEEIKLTIGAAYPKSQEEVMEVRGRDMLTGLPKNVDISSSEVVDAIREPVGTIIDSIKYTLEKTPPELASDIMERGIYLTGGGAMLSGLDKIIRLETGIPVFVAENPLDCVALGTAKVVESMDNEEVRRLLVNGGRSQTR